MCVRCLTQHGDRAQETACVTTQMTPVILCWLPTAVGLCLPGYPQIVLLAAAFSGDWQDQRLRGESALDCWR